jgi:hypothetical protein
MADKVEWVETAELLQVTKILTAAAAEQALTAE